MKNSDRRETDRQPLEIELLLSVDERRLDESQPIADEIEPPNRRSKSEIGKVLSILDQLDRGNG